MIITDKTLHRKKKKLREEKYRIEKCLAVHGGRLHCLFSWGLEYQLICLKLKYLSLCLSNRYLLIYVVGGAENSLSQQEENTKNMLVKSLRFWKADPLSKILLIKFYHLLMKSIIYKIVLSEFLRYLLLLLFI